jgi:hypothetical protein
LTRNRPGRYRAYGDVVQNSGAATPSILDTRVMS